MILKFSFQNFRSVREKITLSFEATNTKELEDYYIIKTNGQRVLKLGLIYGANASGKTTILKALNFLRKLTLFPFVQKNRKLNFKPFLFDEVSPGENSYFELEFIQNETKYRYELELNEEAVVHEKLLYHRPNKALVFKRTTDVGKQLTRIDFGKKIKVNKYDKATLEGNTLWNNTVLGGFLKTNLDAFELQETVSWFRNNLTNLIQPETDLYRLVNEKIEDSEIQKEAVIDFLKKADFNISDFSMQVKEPRLAEASTNQIMSAFFEPPPAVYYSKKQRIESLEVLFKHRVGRKEYHLPYEFESSGTQRYYQLGGLLDLLIRNQKIVPIDELESSLHPDLLKHFLLVFLVNSKQSQLIATTHFREFLMERDIYRNDVIWFAEKDEEGNTELFSLADFDSSVIRNTSSVYKAYKIGKLGARPHIGDYFLAD